VILTDDRRQPSGAPAGAKLMGWSISGLTSPKCLFVALMRHDMIGVSRGDNLSILQTNCAKRLPL
jgi:hypothetical protein